MGSDYSPYFRVQDGVTTKPPHDSFACLNKVCPVAIPPYCPYVCKKEAEEACNAGQLELIINGAFYAPKPEEREMTKEPALVGV